MTACRFLVGAGGLVGVRVLCLLVWGFRLCWVWSQLLGFDLLAWLVCLGFGFRFGLGVAVCCVSFCCGGDCVVLLFCCFV